MRRRSLLRCVAAASVVTVVPSVVPASADEREPWYCCEVCERPLYVGDLAAVDPDGVAFCERHAPTWLDVKREQDELIAAGKWGDLFDDDGEASRQALYTDHMAERFPDTRVVCLL